MTRKRTLVVIGNGMVGHHLLEKLADNGALSGLNVVVLCEEPRLAYDRVGLSQLFAGKSAEDLALVRPERYQALGIEVRLATSCTAIDRNSHFVVTTTGERIHYDVAVLATGSYPFVPPIPGRDLPGCFVYRTIEDLEAIRAYAAHARVGAVVGGGLLGLEAAYALSSLGLKTHVVEFAPRLMALQVDEVGGTLLKQRIESIGLSVHLSKQTTELGCEDGRVAHMYFADGNKLATDMVVFSAGVRPRDDLARRAGLAIAERGGIVIDETCRSSDPDIFAIGECAAYGGRTFGLVAPGYRMAEVVADHLANPSSTTRFTGADLSTKLKLMGVDVASFGDAFARTEGAQVISLFDSVNGVYKKLVLSQDKQRLLGGILVGDASAYGQLLSLMQAGLPVPERPETLILPTSESSGAPRLSPDKMPDTTIICSCHNVTKGTICDRIRKDCLSSVGEIKSATRAGTGCGSCVTLITPLLNAELKARGVEVRTHLCEHFAYSRQELYHLVRTQRILTFDDLLRKHGRGLGCEICKPAVASILASAWNEHILDKPHLGLQDTNDRYLANIQRDGTYSVVPRVAGGEITPDKLIALGQVAKKYGLYCKITGGQRVDLFGARLEQLPDIWSELIAAGFESGHAYGKALRTVKSCVGSTWCRYGVQDSVGLAIRLENRYKGLRSPHKLKSAVSGCARECAEAQSKDFGVIATDKGYNLYVCGNGGMKPQHAQLLAADLDEETLIRYLDRFLMFYVRTADRLQRTSTWFNGLEGGIAYLRDVIVNDSLGICDELEAEMAHVIATYQCEWKATVEDPERRKHFRAFVNTNEPDPSIAFVPEREQHRPAFWSEKEHLIPLRRRASH